jgi:hypothetical protein
MRTATATATAYILKHRNIAIVIGIFCLLLVLLLIATRSRAFAEQAAIANMMKIKESAHPKESFAPASQTIETPGHDFFRIDLFKQPDVYDNYNMGTVLKAPAVFASHMLMSQQAQRQFLLADLTAKFKAATNAANLANDEANKSQEHVSLANNREEKARKDKEKAEITLAQSIVMQVYTASNAVSIDPSVIIKTATALATAIANVTMAEEGFRKAKQWYELMQRETARFSNELVEYKIRASNAATELMVAQKNLNDIKTFFAMSGEAEYINKRFLPFGTKDSATNREICDTMTPVNGTK